MNSQREWMKSKNLPRNSSESPMTQKDRALLPSPNPDDFPPGSQKDSTSSPYSAQGGHTKLYRTAFRKSEPDRTFLTFLSSYGSGGVSLRELIMLVTLRQVGRDSRNYWLVNGEVGTFKKATLIYEDGFKGQEWIFANFVMYGVVDSSTIESFQRQLESTRSIEVKYPMGIQPNEASQYWDTDERIWTVRGNESNDPTAPIHDVAVLRGFLDLLIAMPDKDVSPTAQRQREIYYYHAHLLIFRVIRSPRLLNQYPSLLMQAIFVVLQLLTHRYQIGDSLLLDFVRKYSVHSLHLDMNVMLLWAELKEKTFREDYDGLCTIRDRALNLMNSNEVQPHATPRQNGLLGFVLLDLMKSAKTLHFEDLVADTLKAGTKWIDSAQRNGTSIEKTALCEMFATFGIHARNEIIQEDCYLFYGYHLSRAGFLEQGDHFLARGLQSRDSIPLWSYKMERVSGVLRLGRLNEAAKMLKSLRELALQYRDTSRIEDLMMEAGRIEDLMEAHRSVLWKHSEERAENLERSYIHASDWNSIVERAKNWKRSGECAEVFVLLNLYEADCSAAAGRLDDACAKLKSGIGITSSVYDAYIRILQVTLEMRLLEILMRQGSHEKALLVARNLASEILDARTSSTLAPDVVYGIKQQLLDLSNALLSAGNAVDPIALLKSITDIGFIHPCELSTELESYAEHLMTRARQLFETNEHETNPSILDIDTEDMGSPFARVMTPQSRKQKRQQADWHKEPSKPGSDRLENEPTVPKREEISALTMASRDLYSFYMD